MSRPCAITTCKRVSSALCYCCQQSLCLQHLKEHNDLLISQLYPLADQLNAIGDRLKAINIESKSNYSRRKLEQWRMDSHKKIDDFFEQKCQEINWRVTRKMEKHREEIDQIQSKIATLIREEEVSRHDIDLLVSTLRKLDQEVNKIENSNLNIEIRLLMIDDSLIHIEESNISRFDLSKLSLVCKTINCPDKSYASLASNDQILIKHQAPNLCLVDQNFKVASKITWNYKEVRDMCWSSSLDQFIIISKESVMFLDAKKMSIDKLNMLQEQNWLCCTCSDTSLFLSTSKFASSISEYNLLPTIKFVKEWKCPVTCQKEEWINDMKYSNGSIALLIKNSSQKTISLQLRTAKSLDRLWSFKMDCMNVLRYRFRCCLLKDEEWLIMDPDSDRLVHITKDGTMKSSCAYKLKPWCATIFGPNIIAITTGNSVNFHKL